MINLDFESLFLGNDIDKIQLKSVDHFLAVGCSHTAGVGVNEDECYVSKLQKHYGIDVYNLAVPGGNHTLCNLNILSWLSKGFQPKIIIAQWPHPIRQLVWNQTRAVLQNINSKDSVFDSLLSYGEQNFYADWLLAIYNVNEVCRSRKIKIINILLEDIDEFYNQLLVKQDIILHQDKKLPGETWFFDNGGTDGLHHSERCHEQWKTRLIGLIDENTT